MQVEVNSYDISSPYIVFGAGITGKSVVEFLLARKKRVFWVDSSFENETPSLEVEWAGNEFRAENEIVTGFSGLVVKSPGISFHHDFLKSFSSDQIIGECELAASFLKRPLIAVTGSNGKTTVVSLLYEILKTTFPEVSLAGNIGRPLITLCDEVEKKAPIIVEMSSFQIEELRSFHPYMACITNLSPTHMERYANYEAYILTKFQLFKNMTTEDNIWLPTDLDGLEWLKNKSLSFDSVDYSLAKKTLDTLLDLGKIPLQGDHNLRNIYLAYQIAKKWQVHDKDFCTAVKNFNGVPHRLEKCVVPKSYGAEVYNDSKSTNFQSTITALEAMKGPCDLFLGGQKRGRHLPIIPDKLEELVRSKVARIFLIGEVAKDLEKQFKASQVFYLGKLENLKTEDLRKSRELLFSPGFPSFDQYKNFEDRGEAFKKLIYKRIKDLD